MATLAENAAAVKAAQVAIDAAIVAKGGTTDGGLTNAAVAIAALPSGGETVYPVPWKNDGKTHIWYHFAPYDYPYAYFAAQYISANAFSVDWGDGSTPTTVSASATIKTMAVSHQYATDGDYEVTISGYDTMTLNQSMFGDYTAYSAAKGVRQCEFAKLDGNITASIEGRNMIGIKFPSDYTGAITVSGFNRYGYALKALDLGGVSVLSSGQFRANYNLDSVIDISNVALGNYVFAECPKVTFSGNYSATTVGSSAFANCSAVVEFGDFSNVTSFSDRVFAGCANLEVIGDISSLTYVGTNCFYLADKVRSLTFRNKTHTEVMAISGFFNFPSRGTACVFHCSDGDFYRSGNSLLPMPE